MTLPYNYIAYPMLDASGYVSENANNALSVDEVGKFFVQTVDTSEFITKSVSDLEYYYTKTQTDDLLDAIKQFDVRVVSELPTASADTMYAIYLKPQNGGSGDNVKDEYITLRSGEEGSYTYTWEKIGSTDIDLTGYATESYVDSAIEEAIGDFEDDLNAREKFDQAIGEGDGSTAAFTINETGDIVEGSVRVYVNGIRQTPGAAKSYTISGKTVTFNANNIPMTGMHVTADYKLAAS